MRHEWLLTDGIGGSALGTAAGVSARREQALLVTVTAHGEPQVALLKLDERLTVDDATFDLTTTPLSGGPACSLGHRLLEEFRLDPWPVWRYRVGETVIEKSLFMVYGHHALVVVYRHLSGPAAKLSVSPLIVGRAPNALQREDAELRGAVKGQPGRVRIESKPGLPAVSLWHNGVFLPARLWQRGIEYPLDVVTDAEAAAGSPAARRVRGKPAWHVEPSPNGEDALVVGHVDGTLEPGQALHLVTSTEDDLFRALAMEGRLGTPPPAQLAGCVARLETLERTRLTTARDEIIEGADFTARQAAAAHAGPSADAARRREALIDEHHRWVPRLAGALEAGLARRGHRATIVSGLPGSGERGEHTLRALPGLIALRAFDDAAAVLRGYVEYLDDGLVPESFDPATGQPRYGDPAASLWLVHAGDLFARRSGDVEFARDTLYPALESIMQYFRAGTRGGVRVDSDGLLGAGQGEHAEKRADHNALWYHALVALAQLARLVGRKENSAFFLAWARDHQARYLEAFWDPAEGTLFHALRRDGPVHRVSPSLLLAISLPPSLLPVDRALQLMRTLEHRLFTPCGLREDARATRTSTAWLGDYFTAYLRVHQRSDEAQARVREWLELLGGRIGLSGQVPAAFEVPFGSDLRPPRVVGEPGSPVAAAGLLRLIVEELDPVGEPAVIA